MTKSAWSRPPLSAEVTEYSESFCMTASGRKSGSSIITGAGVTNGGAQKTSLSKANRNN